MRFSQVAGFFFHTNWVIKPPQARIGLTETRLKAAETHRQNENQESGIRPTLTGGRVAPARSAGQRSAELGLCLAHRSPESWTFSRVCRTQVSLFLCIRDI